MIYIVMFSLPGNHPEKEWKTSFSSNTVTHRGYDVFFKLGYTRDIRSFLNRLKTFQSHTEGHVQPICLFDGSKKVEDRLHKRIHGEGYRYGEKREGLMEKYGSVECFDSLQDLAGILKYVKNDLGKPILDAAALVWEGRVCEFKPKTLLNWEYDGEEILTCDHLERLLHRLF